ncbi:MAG TPA: sulfite exporter TauE/SafE family protein [Candidatus Acidoferrales bacterium]|nr:sulfite exporter TauE/SafE family protein [Candidatus Acidoferrales bacterium]
MTLPVFALLALVVTFAAFIQGTTGVGFALIVAPVLAVLAPQLVPVCLLFLMIPLNSYVMLRERTALDRDGAVWITLGRFAGTFGGLAILAALSARNLNIAIGASTVLAALLSYLAPSFAPGRAAFLTAGVVTGVTETATGIGGPPLALVYQHEPAPRLRSTIAFCFLVGELVSLVVLAFAGRANARQFLAAIRLVPALALGALLSRAVHERVHGTLLRNFVLLFAIVSGSVLIIRVWK